LFLGKERKKGRKKERSSGKDGGGDASSQAKANNIVFYWFSKKEGSAISIFHLLFFQMNLNYGR